MPTTLSIRQPERGYRFSIDSVLLAGFAAPYCRGAVLDLGTGCGVLLLLLSRLAPGMASGTGVELQEDLLDFARRENFRDNGPDGRLFAVRGDFRGEIPGVVPARSTWWCRTRRTAGRDTGVETRIRGRRRRGTR